MNELNRRDFLKGSTALMTLASFGLLGRGILKIKKAL